MRHADLTEQAFEDALIRLGFRRVGVEGFFTVVWHDDGSPKMGVSIKGAGPRRVDQLSFLIKARNRYLRGEIPPQPNKPQRPPRERPSRVRVQFGWLLWWLAFTASMGLLVGCAFWLGMLVERGGLRELGF